MPCCRFYRSFALVVGLLLPAVAESQNTSADRILIVGTKAAEPFVIRSEQGTWRGISIELWEEIAQDLNLQYEYRELALNELLAGVADGSLDLAVAAITVTPEREESLDFSHPFYSTGLGIAVPSRRSGGILALRRLISKSFLGVVTGLSILLLFIGVIVWAVERRRNSQFGGSTLEGIGSGFWWSAVTMTTVGYGDKAPATFWGRSIGLVWMFAGLIMISTFTAAITSSLTLTQLQSHIRGPADLAQARVGTLQGSAPEASLRERRVTPRTYATLEEAMQALTTGALDAVVYDAPILRYQIQQSYQGVLEVLPRTFDRQDYAIALPTDSALREPLNRALLGQLRKPQWQQLLVRYVGE